MTQDSTEGTEKSPTLSDELLKQETSTHGG